MPGINTAPIQKNLKIPQKSINVTTTFKDERKSNGALTTHYTIFNGRKMELKYLEDITWDDIPNIEHPNFAIDIIEEDLDETIQDITYSIKESTFDKIYNKANAQVDEYELNKLFKKIEHGELYLVMGGWRKVFLPLFVWREDKTKPDKGQWVIDKPYGHVSTLLFFHLLRTVKKSQPSGSVVRSTNKDLFPGANAADSRRAVANTGITSVNTMTDSARKRELEEYADKYPQLQSNASNPLEIDKLKYDNPAYGEFAETMVGVAGVLGTRNVTNLIKKEGKGKKEIVENASDKEIYQDGLAYRKDLPKHLVGPHGFKNNGTLHGTHNLSNAINTLKEKSATYEIQPTNVSGISELKYKYFNEAKGKYVSGKKTVYDPDVFSDKKMLEMSQSAGQKAYEKYISGLNQNFYDISENGVNFRAYINIDPKTSAPYVGNVHPVK